MKTRKLVLSIATLVILLIVIQACKTYYFRSNYRDANKLLHETDNLKTKPFLKAHLKNGDVFIFFDTWNVDTTKDIVFGQATCFDFNRNKTFEGKISLQIDSVALFETNKKLEKTEDGRIAALAIMAGVDVVIAIICLTNPKACFGSCPTFYLNDTTDFHYADAEGFSNAITPSMECFDIDALNNKPLKDSIFSITMKNEALETHCVNSVKLLAYPRKQGERVYQSPQNEFYLCENNYQLTNAIGTEGNVTTLLQADDRLERASLADERDLSAKEEIILDFNDVKNNNDLGLIISFRQTLMTTYFIYSAIGYMGNEVGDIMAKVESSNKTKEKLEEGIKKEFGNIDIYQWNEDKNSWEFQDGLYETGPIAINRQILPINYLAAELTRY